MREWTRTTISGVWPYLLVAITILLRHPTPLLRAEFWAEDGTEFFATAISADLTSLWTPVYGYHFLISRFVAYVATWFPVVMSPYIYAWSSVALNAVATGYVVRDGFSWLIPSRTLRVLLAFLLAIGPGTAEVFGNLANLPGPLTLLGLFMLLERPFAPSGAKITALVILFFSAGQMFLLAPVILVLFWLTRDRRYALLGCLLIPATVLNVIGNHVQAAEAGYRNYAAFAKVPVIFTEQLLLRLFVAPFAGPVLTGRLMATPATMFWPSLALAVFGGALVISRFRPLKSKLALLGLSYVAVTGTFAVIALSRNYALSQLQRTSGHIAWNHRYAYLPACVAILFWLTVVSSPQTRWKRHAGLFALWIVALITAHSVSQFRSYYPRPDLHWPRTAAVIQKALDERQRELPPGPITIENIEVHPVYYRFRFFSITLSP